MRFTRSFTARFPPDIVVAESKMSVRRPRSTRSMRARPYTRRCSAPSLTRQPSSQANSASRRERQAASQTKGSNQYTHSSAHLSSAQIWSP